MRRRSFRHVVKALRPEEEAVPGVGRPPHGEVLMEGGVGGPGGEVKVPGAPLGVEAAGHSHGLQQGGLARAVLPHQKGHAGGKEEGVLPVPQSPHRREGRQVAVRRDGLAQVDAVDVAAWQWDHLPFSAGDFAARRREVPPRGAGYFLDVPRK